MAVNQDPRVASDYQPGCSRIIRQTCLEIATRLGDFRDQMCIVGGLVPSLIIDQSNLGDDEPHVGTIDLDIGFSIVILDDQLYEAIAQRLSEAGFKPDTNEKGNPTAQRWRSSHGITVDFLIQPTTKTDRGGRLRHIDDTFAAFIIPGLDLAFQDSVTVTIDDTLPDGAKARRDIQVCGPSAFTVLKALAFDKRGKSKDAYDLYYVIRHHPLGPEGIGERIRQFGDDVHVHEAIGILQRDFTEADHVGPARVAEFLGGPDDDLQADVAGFVRQLIESATSLG